MLLNFLPSSILTHNIHVLMGFISFFTHNYSLYS